MNRTPKTQPAQSMRTAARRIPMKPLSAFAYQPEGVRFETQDAEEEVVLFLRQHPIVNIHWLIISFFLVIAPFIILPFIFTFLTIPFEIPFGYTIVGFTFWYLVTFGFILTNTLRWFFNIYIVTNERIVDIDFLYLLYKHFSVADLSRIQDISYTSSGFFAAMFNYGYVSIQTAGEVPKIEFEMVPNPEKVVETIRSLTERMRGVKYGR